MRLAAIALRSGYRLNAFETLTSTSDEALRRASLGDRGRLWIVARVQSSGRGRQGRAWSSPPGNVYASLLLVDAVAPAVAPQLGLVAAVAAVNALGTLLGPAHRLTLKWPNDVLAEGRKLCGILVEGSRLPSGGFACVLGFGINRQSHPAGMPYPVTDLFAVSEARPSIDAVVEALTAAFHEVFALWDAGRNFEAIRMLWLDHALPHGTPMTAASARGRVSGRFETIDPQGRLVLATERGPVSIDAGDVFVMDRPEYDSEDIRVT